MKSGSKHKHWKGPCYLIPEGQDYMSRLAGVFVGKGVVVTFRNNVMVCKRKKK